MCGIAGFVELEGRADVAVCERMTAILRHRGPDDSGTFSGGGVCLGHRRLSIIDVAAGHQPMANEDSTAWITYNGEIFNHAALRPALEGSGHVYRTRCDTETILHAYEEHGEGCVRFFRGMFAFAILDQRNRKLFCARDRLGIKPFYYFWDGRAFAFASEIKALLEHPAVRAEFEPECLPEYLALGYVAGERTLFRGIRKLMPGHSLTLDLQTRELCVRRYWDVPGPGEPDGRSEEDWIRECRERLEEAVRTRLMSDVPLGMFLSGGVDSSTIAALLKRMADGPVKTFSVGYREGRYSELGYARTLAESIGTEHHEIVVGREQFFGALPRLIWHEDEPITWPSSVSLCFVSKLAAEQVKVVLTGEGADELFAGYARYGAYLAQQRWGGRFGAVPEGLRRHLRAWIGATRLLSSDLRRKAQHTFLGRDATVESLYLDNFHAAFGADELERILTRSESADPYSAFLRYWNGSPNPSPLGRLLYADQKTYLVELLMKQDQMSMAASIESRVPFLDHPFVEFAARVPERLKIRNGSGKYILKRAVEDLIPREVIHRTKMGFPTPLKDWLRSPEMRPRIDSLCSRDGFLAGWLDLAAIRSLLERHHSGAEDATDRIWRLMNLRIWADLFILRTAAVPDASGIISEPERA